MAIIVPIGTPAVRWTTQGEVMRSSRVLIALVAALVAVTGATLTAAGAQSARPKAGDVGITSSELRLAVIADVDTPVQPGLFQASVDAMKAWAKVVNQGGASPGARSSSTSSTRS